MTIIVTEKLRKEYGSLVAVNDVSLSIEKGQVVGLIGPNGAGKTTLLRMLAGLKTPTSGSIRVLGRDILQDHIESRKKTGYLPDFFNLYNDLTLEECLTFFAHAYSIDKKTIPSRVSEVLEFVSLKDKRNDFIKNLSRGMIQRLGLGVLLVHAPEIFLLDEPASGLDPKARIDLRDILKNLAAEGKTVIISSHILTELSDFCTHIAIMNEGRLVLHGGVDSIRQKVDGSRRISVGVIDRVEQAAARIAELGTTNNLVISNNTLTFETTGDLEALASINTALVAQGFKVTRFLEETAGLEDLFLKISHGTEPLMKQGE